MTEYFVLFIHMCLQWIIAFKNDSKGFFIRLTILKMQQNNAICIWNYFWFQNHSSVEGFSQNSQRGSSNRGWPRGHGPQDNNRPHLQWIHLKLWVWRFHQAFSGWFNIFSKHFLYLNALSKFNWTRHNVFFSYFSLGLACFETGRFWRWPILATWRFSHTTKWYSGYRSRENTDLEGVFFSIFFNFLTITLNHQSKDGMAYLIMALDPFTSISATFFG